MFTFQFILYAQQIKLTTRSGRVENMQSLTNVDNKTKFYKE